MFTHNYATPLQLLCAEQVLNNKPIRTALFFEPSSPVPLVALVDSVLILIRSVPQGVFVKDVFFLLGSAVETEARSAEFPANTPAATACSGRKKVGRGVFCVFGNKAFHGNSDRLTDEVSGSGELRIGREFEVLMWNPHLGRERVFKKSP